MTFSSDGVAASACPLVFITSMDPLPLRASSVLGAQPLFGSDQVMGARDQRYPQIGRKAGCGSVLIRIGNRSPESVQPRERSALSSFACSHRPGSRALWRLSAGSGSLV